jgi:hypothetical protein
MHRRIDSLPEASFSHIGREAAPINSGSCDCFQFLTPPAALASRSDGRASSGVDEASTIFNCSEVESSRKGFIVPQAGSDLETFLSRQAKGYYSFVVAAGDSPTTVDVYPFSIEQGLLPELRLSLPKSAIESVETIGIHVELAGRRHDVVTITFSGDVGAAYEQAFADLLTNLHRQAPRAGATDDKRGHGPDLFKPQRDWCGWHWPTPTL